MVDVAYVELHAGRRLRRSDLRRVYDVVVLAAAVEEELGLEVPYAVMRDWLTVYREGVRRETYERADELDWANGSELRAAKYTTAWHLVRGMRDWTPAVYVTESAAREWLRDWAGLRVEESILSARRLEEVHGPDVRAQDPELVATAKGIAEWLLRARQAEASLRVCQAWLDGKFVAASALSAADLERGVREGP